MSQPRTNEPVIGRSARFRSVAVEAGYREATFRSHRARSIPILALILALGLGLILRDYLTVPSEEFLATAALRMSLFGCGIVILIGLVRLESAAALDGLLFIGALILVAGVARIYATQAVLTPYHHALDVLFIFVVAVILPNRFVLQVVPVLALGSVALVQALREGQSLGADLTAGTVYGAATILAVAAAWNSNVGDRRLFWAREEVRTLRGIVPICAECQDVRDGDGVWHQMESYISGQTEATFSHGLCPSCYDKAMVDLGPEAIL